MKKIEMNYKFSLMKKQKKMQSKTQKKVAILQSNYIPWKGYFDLIAFVDEFIIYDCVQYTRRDWRNRNQIKTPQGLTWLSIPVKVKGKYYQKIRETESEGVKWAEEHWKSLSQHYARAARFASVAEWLESLYLKVTGTESDESVCSRGVWSEDGCLLTDINMLFIQAICDYLEIKTTIKYSWDYILAEGKSECLLDLCLQAGASEYVSGSAAKGYLDEGIFVEKEIKVTWFNYDNYPEYPQLWGEFVHGVSILDLLFNCGRDAREYMRYV